MAKNKAPEWKPNTEYDANSMFTKDDKVYQVLKPHRSAEEIKIDLDDGNIRELVKETEEQESARKKADPNKVNIDYYIRTVNKKKHMRFCVSSAHRGQLTKEKRLGELKTINEWDKEIDSILDGTYKKKEEKK